MEKTLEDDLYQAVTVGDQEAVSHLLLQGANPNKTIGHGKTCLGQAAYIGNVGIVKLLIDASKASIVNKTYTTGRKRHIKLHKRKLRREGWHDETVVKYKNVSERTYDTCYMVHCENIGPAPSTAPDKNQGYFVFIHSDGSSSDENRIPSLRSPLSSLSLTPSPQADLEWDEEIGNVAPTTSEDETWSSMYKWYAAILESTGAAIASASGVTYGMDQQDVFMKTALHYAAMQGHAPIVNMLLEAGCKVDLPAGDGLTPLHVAVVTNDAQIVEMLIVAGSHVNYKTHEKMTALHFAASRGYLHLVNILVNNGAYLEARDTSERTALYLAAGRGHVDVVECLVASGANVNGEEIHGYTPLCEAVWHRYTPVVKVLLESGARVTHSHHLLHNAIIQRQVELVEMLAARGGGGGGGGGLNLHNEEGDTPLVLAARLAQPDVVRILLEKGANVNSCNSITGAGALHFAVEHVPCPRQFEELLACLLERGADIDAPALTGDTPLNRALLLNKDHEAFLLIRYGADVNVWNVRIRARGLHNLALASRRHSYTLASALLLAGHRGAAAAARAALADPAAHAPCIAAASPRCAANWLRAACTRPLALAEICRIAIRLAAPDRYLFRYIRALPLPRSLKSFLMMEELPL